MFRPRGRQRTDSTHVLAAVRVLNRLERVSETMHAALNGLAVVAPGLVAECGSSQVVWRTIWRTRA